MKLQAEINQESVEIEIRREGETVVAEIDGRKFKLEVSQPEPNTYLFKNENKIFETFVSPLQNAGSPLQVKIKNNEFEIILHDPKRLRDAKGKGGQAEGIAEIKTAMPGKVVRVLTESGTEIKAGEGVIVVEAMKMQNELKSPKDGVLKEIRFKEGDTVNAGDILALIE